MLDTMVCSEPFVWLLSPAWDAVLFTLDVGFVFPFVVIDSTDKGALTVVAPGRMIYNSLTIPDAESLPLHRMALKLACVGGGGGGLGVGLGRDGDGEQGRRKTCSEAGSKRARRGVAAVSG